MTDNTPSTELTERLQALGRHSVDPATASQHLSAMAGVSLGRTGLRQKLQVAGALLAGIFIGGTGLATAGALGDSAEHRADKIVAVVTGKSDKADKADKVDKADKSKADRDAEDELTDAEKTDGGSKCPAGENHGQAVRAAAHETDATGTSVSEVARDKTACAAKPGTADADTADAEKADKADRADKASENGGQSSGQGSTKASDAQKKAEDARTARSDNSNTTADVSEDADSNADGAGRTGTGSGKRSTGGSARADVPAGNDD